MGYLCAYGVWGGWSMGRLTNCASPRPKDQHLKGLESHTWVLLVTGKIVSMTRKMDWSQTQRSPRMPVEVFEVVSLEAWAWYNESQYCKMSQEPKEAGRWNSGVAALQSEVPGVSGHATEWSVPQQLSSLWSAWSPFMDKAVKTLGMGPTSLRHSLPFY